MLLCTLLARAKFEGRQLRVLVTAVTHEAINNLLVKPLLTPAVSKALHTLRLGNAPQWAYFS